MDDKIRYQVLYDNDNDVREYVDRYCNQHNKDVCVALAEMVIRCVIDEIIKNKK